MGLVARNTGYIQAEIDRIESTLASATGAMSSITDSSTSRSIDRKALEERLDLLYARLDRINSGGMIVRGVVRGLRF